MDRVVWIVIAFLVIYCILALIPAWHQNIYNATQSLDAPARILLRFLFDPLEYAWKWIVGLLGAIIFFSRRAG